MNETFNQINRGVKRCNSVTVPKVGNEPLSDPQCRLDYGHDGDHCYGDSVVGIK